MKAVRNSFQKKKKLNLKPETEIDVCVLFYSSYETLFKE